MWRETPDQNDRGVPLVQHSDRSLDRSRPRKIDRRLTDAAGRSGSIGELQLALLVSFCLLHVAAAYKIDRVHRVDEAAKPMIAAGD